jgi:lipopolysaccharide biosynthesis protein
MSKPHLKVHVKIHIEHFLKLGIEVILIINTDLPSHQLEIDPGFVKQLSGVWVRENTGFDFAAWAHAYSIYKEYFHTVKRLYLVNDSIVGPLNTQNFESMIQRVKASTADHVGLTQNIEPIQHLKSFFLVFNESALRHTEVKYFLENILNLPTKHQVVTLYETHLTNFLIEKKSQIRSIISYFFRGQVAFE